MRLIFNLSEVINDSVSSTLLIPSRELANCSSRERAVRMDYSTKTYYTILSRYFLKASTYDIYFFPINTSLEVFSLSDSKDETLLYAVGTVKLDLRPAHLLL